MVPGYAIIPPSDSTQDGQPVFGSYTVVNAWPQKLSEQRTLYLDQFTGKTVANATAAQDGTLARLTSFGIAMHMGNQLGVLTRISASVACLGVLLSVLTGLLMWWKRRPAGRSGLPGPVSSHPRPNSQGRSGRGVRGRCCSRRAVSGVRYIASRRTRGGSRSRQAAPNAPTKKAMKMFKPTIRGGEGICLTTESERRQGADVSRVRTVGDRLICIFEDHKESMASTVTIENQWASAAETGMAAVFGTISNKGDHEGRIVSGESPIAGHVEVHEVVPDASGCDDHASQGGWTRGCLRAALAS